MKETEFIQQNKEKWERFEKIVDSTSVHPKELGELYTEINADLSYAETFYKSRTVRAYLNFLAQRIHSKLYKQKRTPVAKIWNEWSFEIPLEIYRARKNLLFAFVLFCAWVLVGIFSTHVDESFVQLILGSNYVDMTERFIEEGNPMGVYGEANQTEMFLGITINNIQVALLCFVGGALFSLGTHLLLFQNSIMLGAFQYFFHLKGLLLTSFLAVWIHGAFEISAIIVASGAGFTLGHGMLFPGSYSRMQAFQMSAMRGIRIMLSLIPVFIIAGFLESFVTRHYQTLPDWSKWMIILFSFALMLFYYVVYPLILARKHPELVHNEPPLIPTFKKPLILHKIKSTKEVLGDVLRAISKKGKVFVPLIFKYAFPLMVALQVLQIVLHYEDMNETYYYDWSAQLSILFGNPYGVTFNGWKDLLVGFAWVLPLTICVGAVLYSFIPQQNQSISNGFRGFLAKNKFQLVGVTGIFYSLVYFFPYWFLLISLLIIPFFLLILPSSVLNSTENPYKVGFSLSKRYWSKNFGILIILFLLVTALSQPIALIFSSPDFETFGFHINDILDLLVNFIERLLTHQTDFAVGITNILRQVVYILFLIFVLILFILSSVILYYSAHEEVYATGLWEKFKQFGERSRTKEVATDFTSKEVNDI